MESPEKRLLMALLVPLGALAAMAIVIGGLGVLFLALAHAKHELYSVKEPLAVIVALIVSGGILAAAALLARRSS